MKLQTRYVEEQKLVGMHSNKTADSRTTFFAEEYATSFLNQHIDPIRSTPVDHAKICSSNSPEIATGN
jgi:hypothetical protein